jgi:hypothetical protein
MGCHTWFYNNIDNMPKEHMSSIKENLITSISGYWILNTSKEDCIKEIKENIDVDTSFDYLKEMLKDGYYESQVSKYKKYLDILNDDTDIDSFKSVVKDCYHCQEIDNVSFYGLTQFGWHDKFRVYGYPEEIFYDAQTIIDFLKNYDQKMIGIKGPTGFNADIENIINEEGNHRKRKIGERGR